MNKFKRKLGFLSVLLVVILSIQGIPEINNNIIPKAAATSATLHVTSQDTKGNIITGFYQVLQQAGTTVATGFTPVDFTLDTSLQYTLAARGFGSYVFDHWLDTGSTVNPRPVSITTNTQLTAVYRITAISLNPTSGPAGTTVTVSGSGFAANSGITISYDGAAMTTNPGTITTDSTGAFSGSITVPLSSAAGPHMVKATDASNHPASASFTVTTGTPAAAISLNPTSGPTGTTVNISGSNFAANSGITISYDNAGIATTPTTITTTSTGSFTGSITIPSSSIAGSHTVKATDASANSASAQFTVTTTPVPAISLNPTSGPTGTTVNISGSNFAANSGITISYDNAGIATTPTTITTTSTGSFTGSITIPSSSAAGTHTVKATDTSSSSASASFTVTTGIAISLYPSSANVGSTIRITGNSFSSNSQINIYFDGTLVADSRAGGPCCTTAANPAPITTDSTGSFAADIPLLDSTTGAHTIKATDQSSHSATQSVTVKPTLLLLDPLTGHAGTTVHFRGSGFAASSAITISFDGTQVATNPSTLASDSIGEFQGTFTVSSTATVGSHQVVISDKSGNTYSSSFNLVSSSTPVFSTQNLLTFPVTSNSEPDRIAFIPDNGPGVDGSGAFMVTEKSGRVDVVKNTGGAFVKQSVAFVTVPAVQGYYEDAGLLGIALDPNWQTTKMVYFYVTVNINNVLQNEVVRYIAITDSSGNIIADTSKGEKLIIGGILAGSNHNGGDLKFDSQGNLYISTGEDFKFTPAQDLTDLRGKILRITPLASPGSNGLLYSIPSTNPFATSSSTTIRKEIYSYGLRNPWSFDLDSQTGKIYVSNIGYNTWETIFDSTTPGNFGWPGYEGPTVGNPQNLANYKEPVYWYPHQGIEPISGNAKGLEAITGGVFYHCSVNCYPSQLQGAYFFGDYGIGYIVALLPTGSNPPQTDPGTGVPKGQVQTVMSGLSLGPLDMAEWNGKLYYVDLNGNLAVLNYN